MELLKTLDKWGNIEKTQFYYKQCKMSNLSSRAYLNVIFCPSSKSAIKKVESTFEFKFPKAILSFYKNFNGAKLFSLSLDIFGLSIQSTDDYKETDFISRNILLNLPGKSSLLKDMLCFAKYGGEYLLTFDRTGGEKIYVVSEKSCKIMQEYDNLDKYLESFLSYCNMEYDENGRKKHIEEQYKDIPLGNKSLTLFDKLN